MMMHHFRLNNVSVPDSGESERETCVHRRLPEHAFKDKHRVLVKANEHLALPVVPMVRSLGWVWSPGKMREERLPAVTSCERTERDGLTLYLKYVQGYQS